MKVKIKFNIQSWARLEKTSSSSEKELILSEGDKLTDKDFGGFSGSGFIVAGVNLEIISITKDMVHIVTDGLVEYNPPSESGSRGVNLMKDSHGLKYDISLDKTLVLVTQSMDTGIEISITPTEIVKE